MCGCSYHPHFPDGETEAQGHKACKWPSQGGKRVFWVGPDARERDRDGRTQNSSWVADLPQMGWVFGPSYLQLAGRAGPGTPSLQDSTSPFVRWVPRRWAPRAAPWETPGTSGSHRQFWDGGCSLWSPRFRAEKRRAFCLPAPGPTRSLTRAGGGESKPPPRRPCPPGDGELMPGECS